MEQKIAEILSTLFGKKILPNENFSMETEQEWDSMKHIEIIMTLEDELNVSFDPRDIPQITSLKKIIAKVQDLQK